jgi:hypothetical protein
MPQLLQSRCPKQVQISGLGHETGTLTHRLQKRLFSPAYAYEVGTSGNALKCDIILPALVLRVFTEQSVYFYLSHGVGIIGGLLTVS